MLELERDQQGNYHHKIRINQVENHALSSSDLQVSVLAASRIQKLSLKAKTFSTTSFWSCSQRVTNNKNSSDKFTHVSQWKVSWSLK